MAPKRKKSDLELIPTRKLLADIRRSMREKMRKIAAASGKPKSDKR